jgi:FkbM family methyltransferase
VLETLISNIFKQVPPDWRRRLIGRPDHPSLIATIAHRVLNRISDGNSRSYACSGALAGYRMYVDWSQFRSFIYDSWEPAIVRRVVSEIRTGMTVVDVGAHHGYYTLLLSKYVGPTGRVISFEPLPTNFAVLKKNVEANQLEQVMLFSSAIFSRCGVLTISVPDDSNSGGASTVQVVGAQQVQVQSTTLDLALSDLSIRPDFVKIDVEGCEFDVLTGAQETIRVCRPKMLIELHHFDGNLAAHPVPDLLAGMGYDVEWIERSELTSHVFASPRTEALSGTR